MGCLTKGVLISNHYCAVGLQRYKATISGSQNKKCSLNILPAEHVILVHKTYKQVLGMDISKRNDFYSPAFIGEASWTSKVNPIIKTAYSLTGFLKTHPGHMEQTFFSDKPILREDSWEKLPTLLLL